MKKFFSFKWLTGDIAIIGLIASLKFILSMAFSGSYGYFRDELYYIACSDHLDWGYVDHPPLSIFILKISRWLLEDSLPAIRFTSALAGAAVVFLTAMIARKLGGGRFSQIISACAAFLSPIMLLLGGTFFSMNAFDFLFWALSFYILVTIIKENRPKLWPLFGLIAGLGLMNKYSILFLGLGLVAGLLLTKERKHIINKWFWAAAAIVFLIMMPHIIWQIINGFPSLQFMHSLAISRDASTSIGSFLFGQILCIGFGQLFIWIAGLYYFFFDKEGRKYNVFGLMYPVIFIIMLVGNAKVYYLSPIYPLYFAAGAVLLEGVFKNRKSLGTILVSLTLTPTLILLPYAVPMLPVEKYIEYSEMIGITADSGEGHQTGELPQHYADMFGWEELAAKIAGIYNKLTPVEKEKCAIFVRNWGEAGAVDFFGEKYNLPNAYCGHNSYWYWAELEKDFDIFIILGSSRDLNENLADLKLADRFDSVELAGETKCRYCMPYENGRQIFLCKGPKFTLKQIWDKERIIG